MCIASKGGGGGGLGRALLVPKGVVPSVCRGGLGGCFQDGLGFWGAGDRKGS